MRHVLVTGGAGYIGTHTVVALVSAGARVTVVDSLVNAHGAALDRARALVDHPERIAFVHVSGRGRRSRGRSALRRAVRLISLSWCGYSPSHPLHFAGGLARQGRRGGAVCARGGRVPI